MRPPVAVTAVVAIVLASLSPVVTGAATGPFEVFIEPAAGFGPVYSFIGSAKHSLDMTMYELEDPTAEADLAADAARGVDVRVLLDSAYAGAGANKDAAAALSKAGAHVRWATSSVIVHQKTIVVDSSAALVMTANLTSGYYSTSADFLVEDRQPADVATIVRAFDDDWGGDLADSPDEVPVRGQQGDLVFSPGSEGALVGLIESARSRVETSNEEMGSAAVEVALEADARRGVNVEVLMTADSSWDSAFKQLGAGGVHVRLYPDSSSALYIHAKTIVVDGTKTYVGSINYSTSSMVYNRELGLITTSPEVTGPVARAFAQWWASAPEVGPPAGTSGPTTTSPSGTSSGTVPNKSPSGHYYRPGEYCPKRDLGKTITDPYGTMTCEEPPGGGQPRWTST